jgi:hypothetical protein
LINANDNPPYLILRDDPLKHRVFEDDAKQIGASKISSG